MRAEVKSFQERNPYIIGSVGVALTAGVLLLALNYRSLPFVDNSREYSAYFADSSGLMAAAPVQVSGMDVGHVSSLGLDGPRVLVKFTVDKNVRLGDRTEAAIKTKSLLGAKVLEVTPRGDGADPGVIPLARTTSAYQLPDALGDLTSAISGLDTGQLSTALTTLSDTFKDTPPAVKIAVDGVARFSDTLDKRDVQLRNLLTNANKTTTVLAKHTDQIVTLLGNSNTLLLQLQTQSQALDEIAANLSAVSRQVKGLIDDDKGSLAPALDKLNGALTLVDNQKEKVQESIKKLNNYAMSLGESVASGPFFKAYLSNLLPGQFIQPFVDAAFSDLGLDPNVLLPSQRTDPQDGQAATPPLPVPYPRTGQGGEPRLNLPDAITGNPGDPRYPYREPLPAPAPGGPPPGPPAGTAPGAASAVDTPAPVLVHAPGEVPGDPVDSPPVAEGGQ